MAVLPSAPSRTDSFLRSLLVWRLLFGVATLSGVAFLFFAPQSIELAPWLRWVAVGVLILLAVASLWATPAILRRDHLGRTLSLVVDYLGFVVCLLSLLQVTDVFLGINALADTFPRGIPWLLLAVGGYLILAIGDRYEDYPARAKIFRRAGTLVMAVAGLLFFWSVDGIGGLVFWLRQLADPLALALLVGALLFGLALWAMGREPTAAAMHAQARHEQRLSGWLFLSPNLLGFLIFFAGPLLLSLYFSFTDSDAFNPPNWIGLDNYTQLLNVTFQPLTSRTQLASEVLDVRIYDEVGRFTFFGRSFIFGAQDKLFWLALRNTLLFALLAVPLSVIPALLLSNILNSKLPGMKFFRAIYFLPSIAAVVGISLVWRWLYDATIGYINYGITTGVSTINTVFGAGLVDPKVQWLSDSDTALLAIVIMAAWQTMGFNSVLFLAGLQNIPNELYEAATVDGAGRWAQFWRITLPLLAPTTFFVITTTTIQALQVFEQVFILMNPPEGPNNSTVTLVVYLYRNGFQNFRQGYASAVAWVLFIVIFGLTLFQFRRQRETSESF
ncbi:MAG: sugar ABC transporter permease [Chloroflexota bacterium]|nr:sugar ABC transporter permease [Chloroflexota bacterium]